MPLESLACSFKSINTGRTSLVTDKISVAEVGVRPDNRPRKVFYKVIYMGRKPEEVVDPLTPVVEPESGPYPLPARRSPLSSPESLLSEEPLLSIVENYLHYYAAGDSHTARAKRYDLQHFLEFLAGNPARVARLQMSDWTMQRTKDFVDDRLSMGEAPATVARRLATIKHFGRTIAERVPGYINPAREVKTPLVNLSRPHGLSQEEIDLLRQAAREEVKKKSNAFIPERNMFLLELLLATGLRADEVRLLMMSQVSEDYTWLKNVKTKGRHFRNVYLHTEIREMLERYMLIRRMELTKKFPAVGQLSQNDLNRMPVLISLYGARLGQADSFAMSPKTVWNAINGLGRKARIMGGAAIGRLHPHRLRHTFAHGLLDSSKDVRLVAQALGHSDVRTTMRYTERTEQEIAKAIESKVASEKK